MRAMATASRTAAKAPRLSATIEPQRAECAKNTQLRTGLVIPKALLDELIGGCPNRGGLI